MKLRNVMAAAALGAWMGIATPALAQDSQRAAASSQPGTKSELADGEIRRLDTAKGTVMLRHGEIKSINMGAMTMSFRLKDPALATGLQVGDKVKFAAEQQGDQLIVTRIEKVQ